MSLNNTAVFFNLVDFAETREFVIADGTGGTKTLDLNVVWDEDELKVRGAIISAEGVFLGDVCVYIPATDLPRRPEPGETIQSPRGTQWIVRECTENFGVYDLSLQRMRVHAG